MFRVRVEELTMYFLAAAWRLRMVEAERDMRAGFL